MIYQIWAVITSAILILIGMRALRFKKSIVALRDVKPSLGPWPKISFIVAACNEESSLRDAARSLLGINYPNLEIILINDRSTDDTGFVIDDLAAAHPQIKAVHIRHLPQGWLGKVHALHRGVEATNGEWILFADADIHFSTETLKKAVTYCRQNQIDFLTSVPEIRSRSPMLRTIIGQLFHQGCLFIDPARLNDPSRRTCYGMGAFMLFRRAVYNVSEKMQWLRMEAIDDGGLALMLRKAGARMGALAGIDEIHLEWYPSVTAYIKGVEKNAFALCQYSWAIVIGLCISNWLFVLGLTLAPLKSGAFVQTVALGSLTFYFTAAYLQMNKMMRLPIHLILFFPFATALLPMIYLRAAILATVRGGIIWRGTHYSLVELKKNQRMKLANLVFSSSDPGFQPKNRPFATVAEYVPSYRIANDSVVFGATNDRSTDKSMSSTIREANTGT
jgi:glycosyltransferase involved in cell wall biosynthesis